MNKELYVNAILRQGVTPVVTDSAIYVSDVRVANIVNETVVIVPIKDLMHQPMIASIASIASMAK